MKKLLKEEINKDLLTKKTLRRLKESGVIGVDIQTVADFVNQNSSLLVSSIDTVEPHILSKNYIDFVNSKRMNESVVKRILKEADEETAEPVDKVALIQDLADIQTNLSDSFSRLYQYKGQYMDNDKWGSALTYLRINISELLTKAAQTMSMIGGSDSPSENI